MRPNGLLMATGCQIATCSKYNEMNAIETMNLARAFFYISESSALIPSKLDFRVTKRV